MPDNIGEMFYYGETPWHKKGHKIEKPATAADALKFGCLDWQVEMKPLETVEDHPSPVRRRMAVVRVDREPGDPCRVLGVVHPGFRPLQNKKGIELFDALVGQGKPVYHTGGYLGSGEVIWLLARLDAEIRVDGKDVVEPYMLFTNSHDGSIAIDFRLTAVRVVCQNTLTLALRSRETSMIFKRAHQGSFSALERDVQDFFRLTHQATHELNQVFDALNAFPFGEGAFASYVEELVPLPKPPDPNRAGDRARQDYEQRLAKAQEVRSGLLNLHRLGSKNGKEIPPAALTLWGALNTVTAYVDHFEKIGDRDRYVHSIFGAGAVHKRKAFELAVSHLPESNWQMTLFQ